jgi:hypothetical protein
LLFPLLSSSNFISLSSLSLPLTEDAFVPYKLVKCSCYVRTREKRQDERRRLGSSLSLHAKDSKFLTLNNLTDFSHLDIPISS